MSFESDLAHREAIKRKLTSLPPMSPESVVEIHKKVLELVLDQSERLRAAVVADVSEWMITRVIECAEEDLGSYRLLAHMLAGALYVSASSPL